MCRHIFFSCLGHMLSVFLFHLGSRYSLSILDGHRVLHSSHQRYLFFSVPWDPLQRRGLLACSAVHILDLLESPVDERLGCFWFEAIGCYEYPCISFCLHACFLFLLGKCHGVGRLVHMLGMFIFKNLHTFLLCIYHFTSPNCLTMHANTWCGWSC